MPSYEIRAVVFEEEGWLVAQCLEVDIAVQARRHSDLLYQLEMALAGQILVNALSKRDPFRDLPRPPVRFMEMWDAATLELTPRQGSDLFSDFPEGERPAVRLRAA